jgi:hypothetical protein
VTLGPKEILVLVIQDRRVTLVRLEILELRVIPDLKETQDHKVILV